MIAFGVLKRITRETVMVYLTFWQITAGHRRSEKSSSRGGMKRAPLWVEIRILVGHAGGVVRTRKVSTLPQSLRENNVTTINYIHSTICTTILHHLDTSCLGLEVSYLLCRVFGNSLVADKTTDNVVTCSVCWCCLVA
jgi:hypothetical protein